MAGHHAARHAGRRRDAARQLQCCFRHRPRRSGHWWRGAGGKRAARLAGRRCCGDEALRIAPLSASWAKTRIDGREQQLVRCAAPAGQRGRPADDRGRAQGAAAGDRANRHHGASECGSRSAPCRHPAASHSTICVPRSSAVVMARWHCRSPPFATNAAGTPPSPARPTQPAWRRQPRRRPCPRARPREAGGTPWRITLGELITDAARIGLIDESFVRAAARR